MKKESKIPIQSFDPITGKCSLEGKKGRPDSCPISAKIVKINKNPQEIAKSGLSDVCKACETDPEIPAMLVEINRGGHLFGNK
ncbi:MAG: hypothetical protein A3B47_02900 [Candidatus Levybacteria bacterium RIFCSPLOWO2_01_FULL_39_24]|nr:MAG: hypothetical protein A2800_02190 [Candidatus Levybacteria bacterium RIFCSPHIGHO2_01_FULL_40_16]OGH28795.1 MAG: hypothetical protein A3E12_03820 [Candidatus Levybacteria bacterium RIFCSPHIGHO2_12_FULL_39_9]OGH46568.1 MAG: hypothetical protein A3B47_02900 [Candidatus Levybacteria bacterium RIFCSPLOWO2_01_FULL_39_24]